MKGYLDNFFGGANIGQKVEDFTKPYGVVQLGRPPHRIDLLCTLEGKPRFRDLWRDRKDAKFGKVPAHYIGLQALKNVKKLCARPQDLVDLKVLEDAK